MFIHVLRTCRLELWADLKLGTTTTTTKVEKQKDLQAGAGFSTVIMLPVYFLRITEATY